MIDEKAFFPLTVKLAEISRYLYSKGLAPGKAGNISARAGDAVAITPSGVSLKDVEPDNVIMTSLAGNKLTGSGKPSSELPLHLDVYQVREDVGAIVHTHSPYVTGFALAGESIERLEGFGEIKNPLIEMVEYAPPGSDELARLVADGLKKEDVVVLKGHGLVATGETLEEAALLAEFVESGAKTQFVARTLRIGNFKIDAKEFKP